MSVTTTKDEPLIHYDSGARRSDRTGKGRCDLISPHGLRRLARKYEDGAAQKGDRNWEKGFPVSRCIDSAMRHLNQYLAGDWSEDHLAAVAWQMFAAMHFEEDVVAGYLPAELLDIRDNSAIWKVRRASKAKKIEKARKAA